MSIKKAHLVIFLFLSPSLWEKRLRNVFYCFAVKCAKAIICLMVRPYAQHLELLLGDFMKINLPYFDICVANVPYKVLIIIHHHHHHDHHHPVKTFMMILSSPSLSSQDLFSHRIQTAFAQTRPTVCTHTSLSSSNDACYVFES